MGLLNALFGNQSAPGGTRPQPSNFLVPEAAPLDIPTQLGGVTATVTPQKPLGKPGGGYNNIEEVNALTKLRQAMPTGNTGSGLGLSNLIGAKGTLRDVLGTLGDAFLIQAGAQPIHAQQRYREQVANAAAGFENDPAGAASRIMATGAPGSVDDAQAMYNTYQNGQIRKQQQESLDQNRLRLDADRDERASDLKRYRADQQLQRLLPYAGAMVNDPSIKTKEDYRKAYNRAEAAAKRIDPEASGTSLGLIHPDEWEPGVGATTGMTQGENARDITSNRGVQQRAQAASVAHEDRVRGQNVSASNNAARVAATRRGQDMTDARGRRGQDLTNSRAGAKGGGLAIPGLKNSASSSQFQEGKVYVDAKGNKAKYVNGKFVTVK